MPGRSHSPQQLWVCSFVGRCQVLVGVMIDARGADIARHVRQLVAGMPGTLGADEWRVAHHVLSRTVAQIAVVTGVNRLPHIARASVAWDAVGPTNHHLDAQAHDFVGGLATALEVYGNSLPHVWRGDPEVQRILAIVAERFADRTLKLGPIACEAGLTVRHAADMLHTQTGLGFLAHVHRHRVMAASRLLVETTRSIKEVAHAVGYGSSSQFPGTFPTTHGDSGDAISARLEGVSNIRRS